MTQAISPIFAAIVLAFSLASAPCSRGASYMNWNDLKSRFTYAPMAGKSLERTNFKIMPYSKLKPDFLVEDFKVLYSLQLNKEVNKVAKFGYVLKDLNQNHLVIIVKAQMGDKQTIAALDKVESKLAKTTLENERSAIKINPKTESWVSPPRYPSKSDEDLEITGAFGATSAEQADQRGWVRNQITKADILNAYLDIYI